MELRRPLYLIIIAATIVLMGVTIVWLWPKPAQLDARQIDVTQIRAVRLILNDYASGKSPVEVSTSDSDLIKRLATQLAQGEQVSKHKCAAQGVLIFEGMQHDIVVGYLPGHDPLFYEFTTNGGYFRVPRDAFVHCLADFGVPPAHFVFP